MNFIGHDSDDEKESDFKDLGGLGQQQMRKSAFVDTMRKEKASDKRQREAIGSGGEYVLKQNQIIISPEGDQYKIVGYLGQGTFGQVVKCINLQKGTQHAIKIIKNK